MDSSVHFPRPGWEANAALFEKNPRLSGAIYHICFIRTDNYKPECTLNLRDQLQMITSYEASTDANLEGVLATDTEG